MDFTSAWDWTTLRAPVLAEQMPVGAALTAPRYPAPGPDSIFRRYGDAGGGGGGDPVIPPAVGY